MAKSESEAGKRRKGGDSKQPAAKKRKDDEPDEELPDDASPATAVSKEPAKKSLAAPTQTVSDGRYHNKQRCLVLCSRGVTARYRHLLEDLRTLMPHHKKESKLEAGKDGITRAVNDICELRGCNTVLFLECRKRQDAYMWIGNAGGPSARLLVSNIHTMDELKLTGNCMKHSRPILSFDESFGRLDHLKLLKSLFVDVFGTPRGHPKSKPFVDRVMAFYYADNRIWVRNYQIVEDEAASSQEALEIKRKLGHTEATTLVEVGPRFVLDPIRIFRGSFGGQTLYQNPTYVSPNEVRAQALRQKKNAYAERKDAQQNRQERNENIVVPADPLDDVFK